MKKLIVVIFSLSLSSGFVYSSAQVPDSNATILEWLDYLYGQLDTSSQLSTGILMDKGFLDTLHIVHQGLPGDSASHKDEWYELYRTLQLGGYNSLPPPDSVYKEAGMFDLHGKRLGCFEPAGEELRFNSRALSPGIYTVRVTTAEGPITLKLLINH